MGEEQACQLILQDALETELSGKREEPVVTRRSHIEHHDRFRRNVDAKASRSAEGVGTGHRKIMIGVIMHGVSCKAVRGDRIDPGSNLIHKACDFPCGVEEPGEVIPCVFPRMLLPECFAIFPAPAVIAEILRVIAVIAVCGSVNPGKTSPEIIELRLVKREDMHACDKHDRLQTGELQLADVGIKPGAGEAVLLFAIEVLIVFLTRRHQGKILEPAGVFNQPDEAFPGKMRHEIRIADVGRIGRSDPVAHAGTVGL